MNGGMVSHAHGSPQSRRLHCSTDDRTDVGTGRVPTRPAVAAAATRSVRSSIGASASCCAPTGVVGGPPLKSRAMTARTARTDNAARSPSIRACAFSATIASAVAPLTPAFSSDVVEFGVGDERHTAGEFGGGLGRQVVGDSGVVLDAGEERGGERRHQDRSGEGGTDRNPEVGEGVLQAAHLAAVLVGERRHGDRSEL